jgi:hypothetical protein
MSMKPSEAKRAAKDLMAARQPFHLEGPPGIGKSSILRQAASEVFGGSADYRSTVTLAGEEYPDWYQQTDVLTLAPVDARGIPEIVKGVTTWRPPALVPTKGKGLWVIDEYPLADRELQALFRSVLLDRHLCGVRMGKDWRVASTGNRVQDRAGAKSMLSHVASALTIIKVDIDHADTMEWMARAGIHEAVRGYLNWQSDALWDFDPARQINTDPRGWERVGQVLPHLSDDLRLPVFSGMVQEGHASQFIAYLNLRDKLPDVKRMMAQADSHPMPAEPSILYALSARFSELAKAANATELKQLMTLTARMPGDFAARTVRDCIASTGTTAILKNPVGEQWKREHREMILA